MSRRARMAAWYLEPAPPERLAVLRILVGSSALAYLIIRLPVWWGLADLPAHRFAPAGVFAGLSGPLPGALVRVLVVTSLLGACAFIAGWRYRVVGPGFALAFLALTTYRSSWGQVFVTDNLFTLHVLIVGFSPAAFALSADRQRRGHPPPDPDPRFGWPVRLMAVVLVASYFLAGWAKLRLGGPAWLEGDTLRNWVAVQNLRNIVGGEVHSPLGAAAVAHAWLFAPMAWVVLALELGAPAALLGGWIRRLWVGTALVFHVATLALMVIVFYPLFGVAFAPLYRVERLPGWVRDRAAQVGGALTGQRSRSSPEPAALSPG